MHPNQMALPVAVTRWIEQSQTMSDTVAIERLGEKQNTICEAINVVAADKDDVPVEFTGLSVIDLMSAQCSLTAEINTRRRFMAMGIAA